MTEPSPKARAGCADEQLAEGETVRDSTGGATAATTGSGGPFAAADPRVTTAASTPGASCRRDGIRQFRGVARQPSTSSSGATGQGRSTPRSGSWWPSMSAGLSTLLRQEVELAKAEVAGVGTTRAGKAAGHVRRRGPRGLDGGALPLGRRLGVAVVRAPWTVRGWAADHRHGGLGRSSRRSWRRWGAARPRRSKDCRARRRPRSGSRTR